ncbi:hypothetical protein VaNZ11_009692 [Volvox africanus]|uniref:Uncharacterized protein n=1 Tax=Volvox africanus TaxID=51714 RepID=A0ABQ5S7V6_9CHLO|nr:hypothetical protein VaNZ11_009692 [Volvox africanus]
MKNNYLLFGLFLLITLCRESQPAKLYGLEYNPEDFVISQPTCVHRLPLTRVNRLWRAKGIRSFTVLNNTGLVHDLNIDPESINRREAYGYWEDDNLGAGTWRGGNVGDTRAAVTPFLAHMHFGDTYKWMLYGDDDTIFYMTGLLKLLSNFDPEQPLAITDNIWFYTLHTNPGAPRCLPCGFNTSTIRTNHTFTPRPACPFCTRALACGTYGPRYRCNESHISTLEAEFGQTVMNSGSAGGGAAAAAAATVKHNHDVMRGTAARYAAWMDHHVDLKSRFPEEFRDRPSMDWEMRERSDWPTLGAEDRSDDTANDDVAASGRLRLRRLLHDTDLDSDVDINIGAAMAGYDDDDEAVVSDLDLDLADPDSDFDNLHSDPGQGQQLGADEKQHQRRWRQVRRRLAALRRLQGGRKRPVAQGFMDGTPWLSAALGRQLGGPEDPERAALQLPYPFCARHDSRLHGAPAPSCLLSVAGHGGSGIIMSVGLMRMIDPEEAIRYIKTQRGCGGGDCLLGRTMWFRMGIGFTDPGTALQYGAGSYEKYCRFIDSNQQLAQIAALSDPVSMLLRRWRDIPRSKPCDHSCVWLLENVVSLHVRAQNRQVNSTVLEMVKRIQLHRQAYEWIREAREDPEVAVGKQTVVRWINGRYGNISLPKITASSLEELIPGL